MSLTTQTLAIGWALAARRRGVPRNLLAKGLFALLGENRSSLVGRPWGEAVSSWIRATDVWDERSAARALDLLLQADAALKETRASSDEQVLTTLLLSMTASPTSRAAA